MTQVWASEIEPNDKVENASLLTINERGTTGIWAGGGKRDYDIYKINIPEDTLLDLDIVSQEKLSFHVALLDENGDAKFNKTGTGVFTLTRIFFPKGMHYLKISAHVKEDTPYDIYFYNKRAAKQGYELEPNDKIDVATLFQEGQIVKGRLDSADRDVLALETTSDLSLWALSANGQGLQSISYKNAADNTLVTARPPSPTITNISLQNLLLSPGKHYFEIKGDGDYRVKATKIGPAPPEALSIAKTLDLSQTFGEVEPNNSAGTASLLQMGQTREGSISYAGDIDYYRFAIEAPQKVTLTLTGPAKDNLKAYLSWGIHEKTQLSMVEVKPSDTHSDTNNIKIEKSLQPGDYLIEIKSARFSEEPYQIKLVGELDENESGAADIQAFPEDLRGLLRAANLTIKNAPKLVDGSTSFKTSERLKIQTPYDVQFSGEAMPDLAGILIDTRHGHAPGLTLSEFKLEVADGSGNFKALLEERLPTKQGEYAFKFEAPVNGSMLRFTPLHAAYEDSQEVYVGEIKPLLSLTQPQNLKGIDVLDAKNGGHIVYAPSFVKVEPSLSLNGRTSFTNKPPKHNNAVYWVAAFHSNRMAQLTHLEWTELDVVKNKKELVSHVTIYSSAQDPGGPWVKVGEFKRDNAGKMPPQIFEEPIWARYLKFEVPQNEPRRFIMPDKISAFEVPVSQNYKSIIGEWGDGHQESFYEDVINNSARIDVMSLKPTHFKDKNIATGDVVEGVVSIGKAEDHYILNVSEGAQYLRLTLRDRKMLSVHPIIKNVSGQQIDLRVTDNKFKSNEGYAQTYGASIAAGRYDLYIQEAPLSIGVVWDTSGSVAAFKDSIVNAVRSVSRYAEEGRLMINLFPFKSPISTALLPEWSSNSAEVFNRLQHYDWSNPSSDVEGGLLGAAKSLEEQSGSKAIILLTDGETSGAENTEKVWQKLNIIKPRIFVTAITSARNAERSLQLDNYLQSFAHAFEGGYMKLDSQSDFENSFENIRHNLSHPKPYALSINIEDSLPDPGYIGFEKPEKIDDIALTQDMMIILDASGSMLQRIEGDRRIQVAKDSIASVLKDLPRSMNVGLRTFGESSADLCETRLAQPLSKLNPVSINRVLKDVTPVNGAKTPIAAAILATKDDFSFNTNPDDAGQNQIEKLVLLITDGEETCDGDPIAAIKELNKTGLDVTVNIVGFAVDDDAVRLQLKELANTDNGEYFDAKDSSNIRAAIETAIMPSFIIKNKKGQTMGKGILGGEGIEVPPGSYDVILKTQPEQYYRDIVVKEGQVIMLK